MNKISWQNLLETIRESVSATIWSTAVKISRRDSGVSIAFNLPANELVCTVDDGVRAASALVKLWPEDDDWNCSCKGQDDPCVHVAAAVIAGWQALKSGQTPHMSNAPAGRISYVLVRKNGCLIFGRSLATADSSQDLPFSISLLNVAGQGKIRGAVVHPSSYDLAIDRLLNRVQDGNLSYEAWPAIFAQISTGECPLTLDDETVSCSQRCLGLEVAVEDHGPGVRVFGRQSSEIAETFKNGVCRSHSGSLHPILRPQLQPHDLQTLVDGIVVGPSGFADLVAVTLAKYERKGLAVVNMSHRLGCKIEVQARIIIESSTKNGILAFRGLLVYGDPEVARIDDDRLVCVDPAQVPVRQFEQERELSERFYSRFQQKLATWTHFNGLDGVAFVEHLRSEPYWNKSLGGVDFSDFEVQGALTPRVQIDDKNTSSYGFDLDFSVGDKKADPHQVMQAFHEGRNIVGLLGGGWGQLPAAWLAQHGAVVADLLAARNEQQQVPKCLAGDIHDLAAGLDLTLENPWRPEQLSTEAILPSELADIRADLRSYQQTGIEWLHRLKRQGLGALLADDMGLGKTIQTIAILEPGSLIVAPTSVLFNWHNEIARFRPELSVNLYHGSKRNLEQSDQQIVVTSYGLVRQDIGLLSQHKWKVVVLDESQIIKNPSSQTAQSIYKLSATFRVCLSGTPIENALQDLWSQFHFLNRGLLGGLASFQQRYAKPVEDGDTNVASKLHMRIDPYFMRRLKKDVLTELPARSERVLYCDLDATERHIYDGIKFAGQAVLNELKQGQGGIQALELLLRLRQAACHGALVPGQTAVESAKLNLLVRQVERVVASGHKALIFSQWTSFLDLIAKRFNEQEIGYDRIDGSTRNRSDIVKRFQTESDRIPVLLLSLKAAGVGLNLTAADHVFIVDPWWNPAAEDQAADRSHRMGQKNPVMIYKLVTRNTVEEQILQLQKHKKQLARDILEGDAANVSLTNAELATLLSV